MNRPEIEDLLCNLHTGSWYGWTDPNNKVYENLFVHSDHYPGIEKPAKEFLDTELARMQSEYDAQAYARNRKPEYPDIGNQLDALLKHLNYRRTQGDELVQDLDDIIASWLSVKSKYPKP